MGIENEANLKDIQPHIYLFLQSRGLFKAMGRKSSSPSLNHMIEQHLGTCVVQFSESHNHNHQNSLPSFMVPTWGFIPKVYKMKMEEGTVSN